MTNEETLNLLKPIMLDGSEKVGDNVWLISHGIVEITEIYPHRTYSIIALGNGYTQKGYANDTHQTPSLFKVNPFEWLMNKYKNQERLISVLDGNIWKNRVLISFTDKGALCWSDAETVSDAKNDTTARCFGVWKEIPRTITISDAFKMLQTEDRRFIRQLFTVMGYVIE